LTILITLLKPITQRTEIRDDIPLYYYNLFCPGWLYIFDSSIDFCPLYDAGIVFALAL
jgi:hypothetical protein